MWMSTSVAGYGNLYAVRMCLLKRMMVLLKKTHCAMRKAVTRWVPMPNCTMGCRQGRRVPVPRPPACVAVVASWRALPRG